MAINQGFIGVRPHKGISNLFMLYWLRASNEEIINYANGSTFLEISKSNFRKIPMAVPGEAVLAAFDKQVRQSYEHIVSNERESRTLSEQRDALLPRLVSGNLRVNVIGEAVLDATV